MMAQFGPNVVTDIASASASCPMSESEQTEPNSGFDYLRGPTSRHLDGFVSDAKPSLSSSDGALQKLQSRNASVSPDEYVRSTLVSSESLLK